MATTSDPTEPLPESLPELSLTEWVVLTVLGESASHGFAIAKELRPDGDLGRVITVHRPLVYRALDRLVAARLAEPHSTEPGDAGPTRIVHRITPSGRQAVDEWLENPVAHVRDLRIEFLAKVRLNQRRGRAIEGLVAAQQATLAPTFAQLTTDEPADQPADIVETWRRYAAAAARDFLTHLADQSPTTRKPRR